MRLQRLQINTNSHNREKSFSVMPSRYVTRPPRLSDTTAPLLRVNINKAYKVPKKSYTNGNRLISILLLFLFVYLFIFIYIFLNFNETKTKKTKNKKQKKKQK